MWSSRHHDPGVHRNCTICVSPELASQVQVLLVACRQVLMTVLTVIFSSNSFPDGDPLTRITASASNLLSSGKVLTVHASVGTAHHDLARSRCTPMKSPYCHFMSSVFPSLYFVTGWKSILAELCHFSVSRVLSPDPQRIC